MYIAESQRCVITLLSSPINPRKQFGILSIYTSNTLPRSEVMENQQKVLTLKYAQNKRQTTERRGTLHILNECLFRICRAFYEKYSKVLQVLEQFCRYPASPLLKVIKITFSSGIIHFYLWELASLHSWLFLGLICSSPLLTFFADLHCSFSHPL